MELTPEIPFNTQTCVVGLNPSGVTFTIRNRLIIRLLRIFFMLLYRRMCGHIVSEFQIYFILLLVISTTKLVFGNGAV